MPRMSPVRAVLLVLLLLALGLAWWLLFPGRGDTDTANARRDDAAPSVPAPELAGRAADRSVPAPPATTPARVPTWRLEGRVSTRGGTEGVAGATVDVTL